MRYKGEYKGQRRRNPEQNLKNCLSSNCSLKLDYMKSESLVIVNHDVTVNDISNFAHTAHHARRVVTALNLVLCLRSIDLSLLCLSFYLILLKISKGSGDYRPIICSK